MVKKYELIYTNTREVLGTDLTMEEAQALFGKVADEMDPEQAADLFISELDSSLARMVDEDIAHNKGISI